MSLCGNRAFSPPSARTHARLPVFFVIVTIVSIIAINGVHNNDHADANAGAMLLQQQLLQIMMMMLPLLLLLLLLMMMMILRRCCFLPARVTQRGFRLE